MYSWLVIYTKPRSEKKVTERLQKNNIEAYCPLQKTIRQWSDRKKKVSVPLFTGYVFVSVREGQRQEVLSDVGVMNFVYWQGEPAVVRNEEIEDIKLFLDAYASIDIAQREAIKPGDKVSIENGHLAGYRGIVIDKGNNKAILKVSGIGIEIIASIPYTKVKKESING